MRRDTKSEVGFGWKKKVCRSKYDTQKIKQANRVKQQQSIRKKICGLSPGSRTVRGKCKNMINKTNVFWIECCGSFGQLPTERIRQQILWFLSEIGSFESLRSCSQCNAHCERLKRNITYEGVKRERLALVDADVWVCSGKVYSAKGTTWSGSPL